MGANLSTEEKSQKRRLSQSKYVMGKKTSLVSISSRSIKQHSIDLLNNSSNIESSPIAKDHVATTTANKNIIPSKSSNSVKLPTPSTATSEKRQGKSPSGEAWNHLDKLPNFNSNNSSIIIERHSGASKRNKSARTTRYSTASTTHYRDTRYNSILSASGFSNNNDAFQFSTMGDSAITDVSRISFNSFIDHKSGEDNDYIMSIPDYEYPSRTETESPSTDNVTTMEEILDLLKNNPRFTYDILTDIFASPRIRSNPDLQREAFQAAEVWSLRPDDVSAKICVARCRLCGWGTPKNSRQGFKDLQNLALKKNWEAYYHLAQCSYYGVEQASEGYTLSGGKAPATVIQPADPALACSWYKKVIETPCTIHSDRIDYIIAQAKLLIAVTNFTTEQITQDNLEENISYIKDSANAGNRKSEFLLALLLRTKQTTDQNSFKEYYTRSSNKGYTPSQIELGLLLLREQSSEGVSWLNKAATLGDPRAYHHLGKIYEFGIIVNADHTLAFNNYQIAADNFNDHPSQFRLGFHYLNGTMALEQDDTKAFSYLSKAASHQHAESQYFLGIMYRDNKVPSRDSVQNKKEALSLFRSSASHSIHAAITETATCFEKGIGTSVNHAIATQYYEKAVSIPGNCLPSAQLTFATFLHKNGKYKKSLKLYSLAAGLESSPLNTHTGSESIVRTAKLMIALFYLDEKDTTTPYYPQEAFDMLISLTEDSPNQSGEVHYWIAVCYEEGVPGVVKPNLSQSFKHYMISAKLGYSNSQFQVGHMLCKGLGIKEDRQSAFEWLQAAAKQNHANALYYVGIYYYNGSGQIIKNIDQARDYFKRSAVLGNTESMVSYAQICYEKAKENTLPASELERLLAESIRWYKKAANMNHPTSLRELGRIYGTKNDFKTSAEYYEKASKLSDALSTVILGGYYENGHGVSMNKQTAISYYEKAIELGQPTALFAIAELYDKLKTYDKAYGYYKRVTQDTRISTNFKSSKTSRLKMALYSLNYDSNTLLYKATTTASAASPEPVRIQKSLIESNIKTMSPSEAFNTLTSLATQEKFQDAYFWIAQCYQDGKGVSQNTNALIHWLTKASKEVNDINATMELASIYEHGLYGVERNVPYAYQLYQILGERNIAVSQHRLGVIFWRGLDMIPINLGMAVIWLTKSARQSYSPSHWALGQIALENGDLHIAIAWWETAMKLNPTMSHPYLNQNQQLVTTSDADALIKLGKLMQQQQQQLDEECMIVAAAAAASISNSSSNSSLRDEVESLSRVQQENHGLAVQCFGQAAIMGNVEGMYLTAQAWHKDKDYPIALEHFEKAASQDHIPSKIMRAMYQVFGLGGKKVDTVAGFEELLLCCESDPDAYIHLGRCCELGLGTPQNFSKALYWYQLSIESANSSEAIFRIGEVYAHLGNPVESVCWYKKAIAQDHIRAHFRIAFYYIQGITADTDDTYILSPDLLSAVEHFRFAAKHNDTEAMFELGQLLLTTEDDGTIALFPLELQEEGFHWFEIAADNGSPDAQRELGNLYHMGRDEYDGVFGISQDFEKAYDYFSFAAHLGDKTSALFLGTYFEHGICMPPNIESAQTWYTVAVELGMGNDTTPLSDPSGWWPAQLCLARVLHQNEKSQHEAYALFYTVYYTHKPEQHLAYLEFMLAQYELHGLGGVAVDQESAVSKLLVLSEEGYLKAFFQLGQCYENGVGVTKDDSKALELYVSLVHNPSLDQDCLDEDDLENLAQAYYCLAEYYRVGKVVAIDLEKSNTLYQIAAERGSKEAMNRLSLNM